MQPPPGPAAAGQMPACKIISKLRKFQVKANKKKKKKKHSTEGSTDHAHICNALFEQRLIIVYLYFLSIIKTLTYVHGQYKNS